MHKHSSLKHACLHEWRRTVDDAVVAAVVLKCTQQLTSLSLARCDKITDAAVVAVASDCMQAAHVAQPAWLPQYHRRGGGGGVASGCKQLTSLSLLYCCTITDVAVVAVASGCKQLTTLSLLYCCTITDVAVVAVASAVQAAHDAEPVELP